MARINSNPEVTTINFSNTGSTSKENSTFLNTIMPDNNTIPLPKKLSKMIIEAIKSNDSAKLLEYINIAINNNDSHYIANVIADYANNENSSLAYTLLNHPEIQNSEEYEVLKEISKSSIIANSDFIAAELFNSLNSDNIDNTKNLIEKINSDNVRYVSTFYDKIAIKNDERADSKIENWERLKNFLFSRNGGDRKTNSNRYETLIQGILNQNIKINDTKEALKTKSELLKHVLDCFLENAEKTGKTIKVNNFKNTVYKEIYKNGKTLFEHITSYPDDNSTQNTYEIERALSKLFSNSSDK